MDSISTFAVLAFVFSISSYFPYTKAVLKGTAKPTISSWICWLITNIAILSGMMTEGEIAWQVVAYIVGITVIIATSLYKGAVGGWWLLDFICLGLVVIAMGLWIASGSAVVGIILSLFAITIGTSPMILSVSKDPSREPLLPWLLCLLGGICGVIAIPTWNLAAALTPVWYVALQILITLLVARQLHRKT